VLTICKTHLTPFVSTARKIISGTWREGRRRKWKRRVYRKRGKGTGSKGGLGKIRRFYNTGLSPVKPLLYLPHSSLIKHNELCLSKKRQGNRNRGGKQGGQLKGRETEKRKLNVQRKKKNNRERKGEEETHEKKECEEA
jgi:hypothetical protein